MQAILLSATHEHLIQVSAADLKPCGPAVITLAGTFSDFHFTQQCIHFRNAQATVSPNRSMAGHSGEEFVSPADKYLTPSKFPDFIQHVTREGHHIGILERSRYGSYREHRR